MTLQELQNQIKNKSLNKFYIFTGEEIAIQKIYINKISQILSLEIQYVSDLKSIYNKLNIKTMISTKKIYIIIEDIDFIKQEKLWQEFKNINSDNIIIFKYSNIDKRGKFYKQFENDIVSFDKVSNEILRKYIQNEIYLSNENCNKLIEMCNNNYNQILLEINKIINYHITNPIYTDSTDSTFEELDKQGAFHKEISDITFEFIEQVIIRNYKSALDLYQKLKQNEESNIKLLSLLYTNFKTILLIQCCNSSDICKTTGLQYYQVKYNKDNCGYYSIGELVNALKIIQKTEQNIKTGNIEESISIDYILVNIL